MATALVIEGLDGADNKWRQLFYYGDSERNRLLVRSHLNMILSADDDLLTHNGISEYDDFRIQEVEMRKPQKSERRVRTEGYEGTPKKRKKDKKAKKADA